MDWLSCQAREGGQRSHGLKDIFGWPSILSPGHGHNEKSEQEPHVQEPHVIGDNCQDLELGVPNGTQSVK